MPVAARAAMTCLTCLLLAAGACAGARSAAPEVPSAPLLGAPGPAVDARQLVEQAPWTVFVFFSRDCHCLEQHDGRLRDLYAAYHSRGVAFAMIDSEVRASPEVDAAEAQRRRYPFPILIDRGARLAGTLGAQYASYTVVADARGHVFYRGGIDSDETHLRESSTPYLRDALDDLLAGRAPRRASTEALGCSLEKW